MKKIALLLVLLILVGTTAYASEIDLDSMTTEELVNLKTAICEEIKERGYKDTGVPSFSDVCLGMYIPDASAIFGHKVKYNKTLHTNDDKRFSIAYEKVSEEEFDLYVLACRSIGFENITDFSGTKFCATNDAGVSINVVRISTTLDIDAKIEEK